MRLPWVFAARPPIAPLEVDLRLRAPPLRREARDRHLVGAEHVRAHVRRVDLRLPRAELGLLHRRRLLARRVEPSGALTEEDGHRHLRCGRGPDRALREQPVQPRELPVHVREVLAVRVEEERAEERARPVSDREARLDLIAPPADDRVEEPLDLPDALRAGRGEREPVTP